MISVTLTMTYGWYYMGWFENFRNSINPWTLLSTVQADEGGVILLFSFEELLPLGTLFIYCSVYEYYFQLCAYLYWYTWFTNRLCEHENMFCVFQWPLQSTDLNPEEDVVKQMIHSMNVLLTNLQHLCINQSCHHRPVSQESFPNLCWMHAMQKKASQY